MAILQNMIHDIAGTFDSVSIEVLSDWRCVSATQTAGWLYYISGEQHVLALRFSHTNGGSVILHLRGTVCPGVAFQPHKRRVGYF